MMNTDIESGTNKILEQKVEDILCLIGENKDREGLIDTPKRVAKMYHEIFSGYQEDPASFLNKTFSVKHFDPVLIKDIDFYSHCEHHMVPFFGKCHVAYIPNGQVVGLSKIARMVDALAKRLQVQERLTNQIIETIEVVLGPLGIMVVIEAEHMCMTMRGVQKPGSKTITMSSKGLFKSDVHLQKSIISMLNL
ncbi:GTP cyclohydrolase I FolE [Shouchella miscanthi]|uniref:GTP cyclohydrolase 1 n=1 Tax=Shouchella miscanthi TaxID=2598861 RepID=A0ABU6NHN5_9BACI|nr:GTP cyclohydrolase I FolE [Shouchella miscanthi]MED4126735.1 GTP cyclohydrolase I FolE [Shouchella miscanthi]